MKRSWWVCAIFMVVTAAGLITWLLAIEAPWRMMPWETNCEKLTMATVRAEMYGTTSAERFRALVSETYHIPPSAIKTETYRLAQAYSVRWEHEGVKYVAFGDGRGLTRLNVSYADTGAFGFQGRYPTVRDYSACLGQPDYYRIRHSRNVEGDQLSYEFAFVKHGTFLWGVRFPGLLQKQPAPVDGGLPVIEVRNVPPGDDADLNRLLAMAFGSDANVAETKAATFKPWPGDWSKVEIDVDPQLPR